MIIEQLFFRLSLFYAFLTSFLFAEIGLSFKDIDAKYSRMNPRLWGDHIFGIVTCIPVQKPYIFLTLDACDGDLDFRIINFLYKNKIPAVIFCNARWIDKHKDEFLWLAKNELFSIQNHGTLHQPLSVDGRNAYHIKGTSNLRAAYDEVMQNDSKIFKLIARHPRFFRSGTAYYDDITLSMLKDIGYIAVGYDVLGDAGATFNKEQIIDQAKLVHNGSILIYHINHPEKAVYDGLIEVVKILQSKGFIFKKLDDFL